MDDPDQQLADEAEEELSSAFALSEESGHAPGGSAGGLGGVMVEKAGRFCGWTCTQPKPSQASLLEKW